MDAASRSMVASSTPSAEASRYSRFRHQLDDSDSGRVGVCSLQEVEVAVRRGQVGDHPRG